MIEDRPNTHPKGVEAFKTARASGASQLDAVLAFFAAEPVAKENVKQCLYYKSLKKPETVPNDKVIAIIKGEEEKYIDMMDKAHTIIRKIVKNPDLLDGEKLAMIHHTHGYDPGVVEAVFDRQFSSELHDAYLAAYDKHRQKS